MSQVEGCSQETPRNRVCVCDSEEGVIPFNTSPIPLIHFISAAATTTELPDVDQANMTVQLTRRHLAQTSSVTYLSGKI